jgi:hypothetical protein
MYPNYDKYTQEDYERIEKKKNIAKKVQEENNYLDYIKRQFELARQQEIKNEQQQPPSKSPSKLIPPQPPQQQPPSKSPPSSPLSKSPSKSPSKLIPLQSQQQQPQPQQQSPSKLIPPQSQRQQPQQQSPSKLISLPPPPSPSKSTPQQQPSKSVQPPLSPPSSPLSRSPSLSFVSQPNISRQSSSVQLNNEKRKILNKLNDDARNIDKLMALLKEKYNNHENIKNLDTIINSMKTQLDAIQINDENFDEKVKEIEDIHKSIKNIIVKITTDGTIEGLTKTLQDLTKTLQNIEQEEQRQPEQRTQEQEQRQPEQSQIKKNHKREQIESPSPPRQQASKSTINTNPQTLLQQQQKEQLEKRQEELRQKLQQQVQEQKELQQKQEQEQKQEQQKLKQNIGSYKSQYGFRGDENINCLSKIVPLDKIDCKTEKKQTNLQQFILNPKYNENCKKEYREKDKKCNDHVYERINKTGSKKQNGGKIYDELYQQKKEYKYYKNLYLSLKNN